MTATKTLLLEIMSILSVPGRIAELALAPTFSRTNPVRGTVNTREAGTAPPLPAALRACSFTFYRLAEIDPAPLNVFRFSVAAQPLSGSTVSLEHVIAADDAGVVAGGDPDDQQIYDQLIAGIATFALVPSGAGQTITRARVRGAAVPGDLEILTPTPTDPAFALTLATRTVVPWHTLTKDLLPWEGGGGDDPTFHENFTYVGDGVAGPRIITPTNPDGRVILKAEILNPSGGSYSWSDALRSAAGFSNLLDGTPAFTTGVAANCTIQPGLQTIVVSGTVPGPGAFNVLGDTYYVMIHYGEIPAPV